MAEELDKGPVGVLRPASPVLRDIGRDLPPGTLAPALRQPNPFFPNFNLPEEERLEIAHRWLRARRIPEQFDVVKDVLAAIDPYAHDRLLAKYGRNSDIVESVNAAKYLDTIYWLSRAAYPVTVLGLNLLPPRQILDIGAGGCHFLAMCKAHHHSVTAIDLAEPVAAVTVNPLPMYAALAELFGVPRFGQWIKRQHPLLAFPYKFHVVTSFLSLFNREWIGPGAYGEYFSVDDWRFFLNDLADNQLMYPALIHLEMNALTEGDAQTKFDAPEIWAFFERNGGVRGRGGAKGAITFELPEHRRFV